MSGTPPKLLDSALAIAIASATLYFLGLVNGEGDASALSLPRALFSRDLWSTVAYGGEGLLIFVVLLPQAVISIGWASAVTFGAVVLVALVSAYLSRRSKHRLLWVAALTYLALAVHIMLCSYWQMMQKVEVYATCLKSKGDCSSAPLMNRVVFSKTDEEEDERTGLILSVTEVHLVMLTKKGLFVMPMSRLKLIETATEV